MPVLRLLVAMSGLDRAWSVGDLYDCDEATAARMVAAGRAERLAPVRAVVETTMAAVSPERAARLRGRGR